MVIGELIVPVVMETSRLNQRNRAPMEKKMSNKNKWRKRLKRCFKEKNADQLHLIMQKASEVLGQEETERIMIDDIMPNLSWDEQAWWINHLPPESQAEMNQMARQAMFSMLAEDGFELGKDFSVDSDGGFVISDRARDHLLSKIPADKREEIEKQMFTMSQNPYELIEEQLGVPFFDNLERLAKKRLAGMSDRAAVVYIGTICEGVSQRHPQIRDTFIPRFIERTVGYERYKALAEIDDPDFDDPETTAWGTDLIQAAGGEVLRDNGEDLISTEGVKLLSQVYESENISPRELAAYLEQQAS